jgi:hypothetical protein
MIRHLGSYEVRVMMEMGTNNYAAHHISSAHISWGKNGDDGYYERPSPYTCKQTFMPIYACIKRYLQSSSLWIH